MGILNRTPDSFYDRGATWSFDAFLRRAEALVDRRRRPPRRRRREGRARARSGGGRGARPGRARDRGAARAVRHADLGRHLARRRCSTPRATPARSSATTSPGSAIPTTSTVAAEHDATVVATHIRLQPRVADPDPHYDDLVADVTAFLLERARRAEAAGLAPEQIVLDAGLDLGKTPAQSAVLLRESAVHAAPRLPVPAVGVEQAVHRRAARARDRRPARASRSRRSRTASRAGAGSCACTTCSAAAGCAARSTRCSQAETRDVAEVTRA